MLVLSRMPSQRIYLHNKETGEQIEIMLVRLGQKSARIGVHADRRWVIVREEVPLHDPPQMSRTE